MILIRQATSVAESLSRSCCFLYYLSYSINQLLGGRLIPSSSTRRDAWSGSTPEMLSYVFCATLVCPSPYFASAGHFADLRCLACHANMPIIITALRTSMIWSHLTAIYSNISISIQSKGPPTRTKRGQTYRLIAGGVSVAVLVGMRQSWLHEITITHLSAAQKIRERLASCGRLARRSRTAVFVVAFVGEMSCDGSDGGASATNASDENREEVEAAQRLILPSVRPSLGKHAGASYRVEIRVYGAILQLPPGNDCHHARCQVQTSRDNRRLCRGLRVIDNNVVKGPFGFFREFAFSHDPAAQNPVTEDPVV